jgi:methylenetetrahydrofolate dehydrogenase (NADP+)/methenyltetrahydrofolate cyclohydrolase
VGRIIDGKEIAARVKDEVAADVQKFAAEFGRRPGLTAVRVGQDPASEIYVRSKVKDCLEVGIRGEQKHLPATATTEEILATVDALNRDPEVDGILVQLPHPKGADEIRILDAIAPEKDVDGFHLINAGKLFTGRRDGVRACTPAGCMRLLLEAGCRPEGKNAVVIGRSNIVGKPMAMLLLEANATVTMCHSRTPDLAEVVRRADIVVAAVGRPELVRGDWIKPGAYVIDVGMNRGADGKLKGDVDYAGAFPRAEAITPVPGGVGPMTRAYLLENTIRAARLRIAGR